MTDLDPEIWNNPTLGAAAPNENLDRLTKQQIEDRAAKFEDREPREVVVDNTYPAWTAPVAERTGTVPSNFQTVHFADEQPADIPVDSGRPEEDAGTVVSENDGETRDSEGTSENPEEVDVDSEVSESPLLSDIEQPENESDEVVTDSSEESDSKKW